MIADDRIARIESDVAEIKDDVKTINIRLNDSIAANAREFGAVRAELAMHRTDTEKNIAALRAETEKGFGSLRAELATHKTDTEKGFGAVRAEIEKGFGSLRVEIEKTRTEIQGVRTEIVSTKLWMLITGIGTILAILGNIGAFVTLFMRIAKII